ncbi:MAG: release factor glutamine methyltransferase [Bacteriovoracaceae bacterium]|jgi:release factor glutamine methyltransferase
MSFQLALAKEFFEKEIDLLSNHYPGLSWHRFQQELKDLFLRTHYRNGSESESITALEEFFSQVRLGTPFEYISHRAYFFRSEFYVNEDVLIPRSETELLVEIASTFLKKSIDKNKVLDLGTGSGCIALSIAMEAGRPLDVTASDISDKALEVAMINYFRHQFLMPKKTNFKTIKSDRFSNLEEGYDLIATNPPYIKEKVDRGLVHDQVDLFEPHLALYLKEAEYDKWFKDLFDSSIKALNPDGMLLMEGHENHLSDLAPLAEQSGFNHVKILPDLQGSNRFLQAIKLQR